MKLFVGLLLLGSIPATTRPDTAPAAMDIDKGEPHFEGKTILTALEKAVQKRRNIETQEKPRVYYAIPEIFPPPGHLPIHYRI